MRSKIQRLTVHSYASCNWHITSSKLLSSYRLVRVTTLTDSRSRAEKMHEDSTRASETCLIGLCSGLFAATAIASSPSLSGLVPIAVQMVLMAFRTGAYVAALAERLHKNSEGSSSWTYVLPGISEVAASSIISDFHRTNVSLLNCV
jgi:iron transport multicopper oxidase